MITCNTFHKSTALTVTGGNLVMTVTNSTNISNLDDFELVMCQKPSNVVTTAPIPMQITINGTAVSLLNRYSLPIYSNRLSPRKKYYGAYVVPTTGDPFVILFNTPDCSKYAVA